jgi:AraC-like DNA-binding protein
MPTVSAQLINQTMTAMKQEGFDSQVMCERVGIDPGLLKDPDARFDILLENRLWEAYIQEGASAHLGLIVGDQFQPNVISTVAYVMMYAPDLPTALKKCGEYQELLCDVTKMHLDLKQGKWFIEFIDPWYDAYKYLVDKLLVIFKSSLQAMSCEEIFPLEVHFPYPEPQDISPYSFRFPGSKLFFNSSETALIYRPQDFLLPIPFADPKLHQIFDQHASELMEKLGKGLSISQQVNKQLIQLIRAETPSLELVADRLAMSPRNLQLKLKEEGTSYQQLLDDMRKEMALSYLRKGNMSKSDIAFLLGFSGLSTFSHSFKKWTGYSPSAWLRHAAG